MAILYELIERHWGWWSSDDWLTQFGEGADRGNYTDIYRVFTRPHLWGDYDGPGWTANGSEPWDLNMDPVAADGMLFYKGFVLVLLGMRSMVQNDGRWDQPFEMIKDGEHTFTWTHRDIGRHLEEQWMAHRIGCH